MACQYRGTKAQLSNINSGSLSRAVPVSECPIESVGVSPATAAQLPPLPGPISLVPSLLIGVSESIPKGLLSRTQKSQPQKLFLSRTQSMTMTVIGKIRKHQ